MYFFLKKECNHIMKPVLVVGLPDSGICRNMRRDVVHGPKKGHGLDIPNLYIYQGSQYIEYYASNILD